MKISFIESLVLSSSMAIIFETFSTNFVHTKHEERPYYFNLFKPNSKISHKFRIYFYIVYSKRETHTRCSTKFPTGVCFFFLYPKHKTMSRGTHVIKASLLTAFAIIHSFDFSFPSEEIKITWESRKPARILEKWNRMMLRSRSSAERLYATLTAAITTSGWWRLTICFQPTGKRETRGTMTSDKETSSWS